MADLDVVGFGLAIRHVVIRQIRQAQGQIRQFGLDRVQGRAFPGQLITETGDGLLERCDVLATRLGRADGLGHAVAFGLQFLGTHLSRLAPRLQRRQGVQIESYTAARQRGSHGFGLVAKQMRVDHG